MRRKILYIQYTNPAAYPSLEHSSRILATKGWEVLFLGTGSFGADALEFPPHERITVKRMKFCPGGWRQKLHYGRFALWVLGWALRWRPAWVYASDPLSAPVALMLSYLPGIQVVYHEHDSPISDSRFRASDFMRWALWTRRQLARRAALCILPNQQRAERFAAEMGNRTRVYCVWNCPRLDEVGPPKPQEKKQGLVVYYHGNISPSYLPPSILKAMTLLPPEVRLCVIGYETIGTKGYKRAFQEEVRRLGMEGRVKVLDPLPRCRLLRHAAECDVGLAFIPKKDEDINNAFKLGASNKPFDYLACGLALLVSDLPEWRKMYVEPGYGLACDPEDPESIAKALLWFLEHPAEMRAMGERGRQRILSEWNYEREFLPVLEWLKRAQW